MSDQTKSIVIIGAGLAGAKLAEALREKDYTGAIALIGAEATLPYERPPLSKAYLAGTKRLKDFTVHPEQWYAENNIELILGATVISIDRVAKRVDIENGPAISYDKLALATGSRSRIPQLPGINAEGVLTLRNLADSDAIAEVLGGGKRLAILGAGWIGLEVAAQARAAGTSVVIAEADALPLAPLGPEMGEVFAELHRSHGVDLHLGVKVSAIAVEDGRAAGLELDDGTVLGADAVLMAIGALPNIELAADAGLEVGSGVLVNAALVTSDPDIVAAGDIADQLHPTLDQRVRVEHWATALKQPATAADALLDRSASFTDLPYFYTDQYDLGMEYVGYVPRGTAVTVETRGDVARREFNAYWLDGKRRVLAAMNVNIWDVIDEHKRLIVSGEPLPEG